MDVRALHHVERDTDRSVYHNTTMGIDIGKYWESTTNDVRLLLLRMVEYLRPNGRLTTKNFQNDVVKPVLSMWGGERYDMALSGLYDLFVLSGAPFLLPQELDMLESAGEKYLARGQSPPGSAGSATRRRSSDSNNPGSITRRSGDFDLSLDGNSEKKEKKKRDSRLFAPDERPQALPAWTTFNSPTAPSTPVKTSMNSRNSSSSRQTRDEMQRELLSKIVSRAHLASCLAVSIKQAARVALKYKLINFYKAPEVVTHWPTDCEDFGHFGGQVLQDFIDRSNGVSGSSPKDYQERLRRLRAQLKRHDIAIEEERRNRKGETDARNSTTGNSASLSVEQEVSKERESQIESHKRDVREKISRVEKELKRSIRALRGGGSSAAAAGVAGGVFNPRLSTSWQAALFFETMYLGAIGSSSFSQEAHWVMEESNSSESLRRMVRWFAVPTFVFGRSLKMWAVEIMLWRGRKEIGQLLSATENGLNRTIDLYNSTARVQRKKAGSSGGGGGGGGRSSDDPVVSSWYVQSFDPKRSQKCYVEMRSKTAESHVYGLNRAVKKGKTLERVAKGFDNARKFEPEDQKGMLSIVKYKLRQKSDLKPTGSTKAYRKRIPLARMISSEKLKGGKIVSRVFYEYEKGIGGSAANEDGEVLPAGAEFEDGDGVFVKKRFYDTRGRVTGETLSVPKKLNRRSPKITSEKYHLHGWLSKRKKKSYGWTSKNLRYFVSDPSAGTFSLFKSNIEWRHGEEPRTTIPLAGMALKSSKGGKFVLCELSTHNEIYELTASSHELKGKWMMALKVAIQKSDQLLRMSGGGVGVGAGAKLSADAVKRANRARAQRNKNAASKKVKQKQRNEAESPRHFVGAGGGRHHARKKIENMEITCVYVHDDNVHPAESKALQSVYVCEEEDWAMVVMNCVREKENGVKVYSDRVTGVSLRWGDTYYHTQYEYLHSSHRSHRTWRIEGGAVVGGRRRRAAGAGAASVASVPNRKGEEERKKENQQFEETFMGSLKWKGGKQQLSKSTSSGQSDGVVGDGRLSEMRDTKTTSIPITKGGVKSSTSSSSAAASSDDPHRHNPTLVLQRVSTHIDFLHKQVVQRSAQSTAKRAGAGSGTIDLNHEAAALRESASHRDPLQEGEGEKEGEMKEKRSSRRKTKRRGSHHIDTNHHVQHTIPGHRVSAAQYQGKGGHSNGNHGQDQTAVFSDVTSFSGQSEHETPWFVQEDPYKLIDREPTTSIYDEDLALLSVLPHGKFMKSLCGCCGTVSRSSIKFETGSYRTGTARTALWQLWNRLKGDLEGVHAQLLDERLLRQETLLSEYWSHRDMGKLGMARASIRGDRKGMMRGQHMSDIVNACFVQTDVSTRSRLWMRFSDLLVGGTGGQSIFVGAKKKLGGTSSTLDDGSALRVLGLDSGTWPMDGGGVASCRRDVVNRIDGVRWEMVSETGNDMKTIASSYQVETNVQSLNYVPLWGMDLGSPLQNILSHEPVMKVRLNSWRLDRSVIREYFLPMISSLVEGCAMETFDAADVERFTMTFVNLHTFFQNYGWLKAWESGQTVRCWCDAWADVYAEMQLGSGSSGSNGGNGSPDMLHAEMPTLEDMMVTLSLFTHFLLPLTVPLDTHLNLPVAHASHHGIQCILGVIAKRKNNTALIIWDHGVLWRERLRAFSNFRGFPLFARNVLVGLNRMIVQINFNNADIVVPCCRTNMDWEIWIGSLRGDNDLKRRVRNNVFPVLNGMETDRFSVDRNNEDQRPTAVMLSHVYELKGVMDAVRAAAVIVQVYGLTDYRLLIFGSLDKDPTCVLLVLLVLLVLFVCLFSIFF